MFDMLISEVNESFLRVNIYDVEKGTDADF